MAESKIAFNVFYKFFDLMKAKFSTTDGGKHLKFEGVELPEGVSQEAVESVAKEFLQMLRDRTTAIEQAKAEAAERKRAAQETKNTQIIAAEEQNQRTARLNHFLRVADDHKASVKFDENSMWKTRDRGLAGKIASEGVLEFIGPSDDYSYAFSDPEHVGDSICRKCLQKSLKRGKPNAGGAVLVTCSTTGCSFHDYEHVDVEVERPRSVLHGRVQLVG